MTVGAIVFAMLLMTLTLASTQFSPRILIGFVRDRTTQWTAWCPPRNVRLLHGIIAGRTGVAAAFRASRDGHRRDAARASMCGLAHLFH